MEQQMSKGFIVFAQNTESVDYVKQAYALALSIQSSQQTYKNISLVTNNVVPSEYMHAFDKIIEIPWVTETSTRYAGEHRWKLYHVTPYDETIVLDSDMLVLEDLSSWWKQCDNYDVNFCSRVKNHKLDVVTSNFYRKTFVENNLPNVYFGLHYFKKTDFSYNFFKILEFVCNNWEWCYSKFAPNLYQNSLSMDLATAIAINIVGEYSIIDKRSPLEFIHMKPMVQDWDSPTLNWQDSVHYTFGTNGNLIVGNIKQSKVFHYVEKNFISDKMLTTLREIANGKEA